MAIGYQKHGRGAAGVGSPRNIGDFGIQALRERDSRIIESLKLAKAQETERSKQQIAGQENVDRMEFGVEEDIQQLKTDYYQNRLRAVQKRGQQEGQKGKDEARMIKENAEPIVKMFQAIGGAAGKVGLAYLEKSLEEKLQKESSSNYNNTVNALDVEVWEKISGYQFKKDATDAEKVKGLSAYLANLRLSSTPKLYTGKAIGGSAMALTDSVDLLQAKAVAYLIRANITPTAANISQFLELRLKSLGTAYGLIDKNGEWKSHQTVLAFQRAWNIKAKQISKNYLNAEVQRLNKENRDTAFANLNFDKSPENLFNAAIQWTYRPHEKDPLSFHTMADGYRETLLRAAQSKTFTRRELEALGNSPWYGSKNDDNFGKPNKVMKNGKPETIFQKFPQLKEEVLNERTSWEGKWKAQTTAAKAEADRLDNEAVVKPLLDTYAGEDLSDIIAEMTTKHGKDSVTVTNLKLLNQGSRSSWNTKLQLKQLLEAKKNGDHEFLLNMRNASQLTGEARKAWNEKYLPLLQPLKASGFSSKQLTGKHEDILSRRLKFESTTTGAKPETLDSAILHADILWWEKYESFTTGKDARYAPGSADAINATDIWLKQQIEDENGPFAILDSGDQKGKAPAEFAKFLPGGVSWKDSSKYSISNSEYQERIKDLGEVEAAKSDGVVSKEHIEHVARQIAAGKSFVPLPFTRNINGLTTQEFYQHHIDKLGLKTKLVVPQDFKSAVKKDTAYDVSLKKHIENVRTVTGFWNTLITEAEGTRPKGSDDKKFSHNKRASVDNAVNNTTTTGSDGYTYSSERTAGSPLHKPGGKLSPYNSDGSPKPKFKSPKAAENFSFMIKNGFDSTNVTNSPDYYHDLLDVKSPTQMAWMMEKGRDYGFYYAPPEKAGGSPIWRYID